MQYLKTLEFIGASLTIVGSLFPWERAGDFLSYDLIGVRVDFANFEYWITGIHEFPVYDNSGLLVILLTSVIILLASQPPRFIRNPSLWKLIISALLMGSSLFIVSRWLFHRYEYGDVIGKPTLMLRLICIVLGSALLLWRAIVTRRQVVFYQSQNTG
jgi:hypothetical protein